ncbi:hypothetical protein GQ43DRAFT_484974 [Delitschia confertaspora ATCC 74209]|uniref:Uncharacterized protein n=1 Tax=Delitschia confertaspora ATCC 74209 TaxID=1513339 RepID=A0A9P4JC29_9PLEO|nr:hypothetical protein GQ43DRAFT_484974 [Delitschia confertaspora ATCC 74209]
MAEEAAAHHLLNVLDERELSVDLDAILATFESEDTKAQAAAWVNEYLNEETLLTKEELELYESLKKKGVLSQYENNDELVRPILDRELASAIDSLQNSAVVIEEQCEVLEAQRDALMALKTLDKPNLSVEHERNERRRREAQEKGRLDVAIEEISSSITEQLDEAKREVETEIAELRDYVTQRLSSDDKMLAALPNIVAKLVAEPDVSEDEGSIEQWCQAIVAYRTAEIKTKVEITYLKSLANRPSGDLESFSEDELKAQKENLKAELDTLHSEITAVNEMVVEHELRKPIKDLKDRRDRQRAQAKSAWFDYALVTLDYMSKRLRIVDDHAKGVNDFQLALEHISQAAAKKLEDSVSGVESTPRARAGSKRPSLLSPLVALKPPKRIELPPAVEDALRHAGISIDQNSMEELQETLTKAQHEREKKLSEHYASDSSSAQGTLADVIGKADVDLAGVIASLYKYTPFQTVHMMDPDIEKRMEKREKELKEADRELLTAEAHQLSLGDPKVQAFVNKYGGDR